MSPGPDLLACPGCGVELAVLDAPTPVHVDASAACWALYGRLLVRQYTEISDGRVHRLTIATYAVQHPAMRERRPPASMTLELIALCLLLERGASVGRTTTRLAGILERPPALHRLEPPRPNGTINVSDVAAAHTPGEHARLVHCWARDVWQAWAPQHAQVRRWIDASFSGGPLVDQS